MIDVRPDSAGNVFRRRRIGLLNALAERVLTGKPSCSIVDIGGTYGFWHVWRNEMDWSRVAITCVNLDPHHLSEGASETRVRMIQGNACDLSDIADCEYDIAFSNSVIEHVGLWPSMVAMAREVHRVSTYYLVQTPNFWFPIEPHARTPFLHWLPEPWAYRMVMSRKRGFWSRQSTVGGAVRAVQSAHLLDYRQMQELFPAAEIRRERFMGLTKALIAYKDD